MCARLRGVVGRILPRKRRRQHLEVTYGHEFTSFVRHSTLFYVFVPRRGLVLCESDLAKQFLHAQLKDREMVTSTTQVSKKRTVIAWPSIWSDYSTTPNQNYIYRVRMIYRTYIILRRMLHLETLSFSFYLSFS